MLRSNHALRLRKDLRATPRTQRLATELKLSRVPRRARQAQTQTEDARRDPHRSQQVAGEEPAALPRRQARAQRAAPSPQKSSDCRRAGRRVPAAARSCSSARHDDRSQNALERLPRLRCERYSRVEQYVASDIASELAERRPLLRLLGKSKDPAEAGPMNLARSNSSSTNEKHLSSRSQRRVNPPDCAMRHTSVSTDAGHSSWLSRDHRATRRAYPPVEKCAP